MNRYLVAALLGLVSMMAVYGIGRNRDVVQQVTDASRDAIQSTPTSAAEGAAGIESAGQNVTRITSDEALGEIEITEDFVSEDFVQEAEVVAPVEPVEPAVEPAITPVTPVVPATPPADQEAIPALW